VNILTETGTIQKRAGKYLTFKIATEEYGLQILKVQEIIGIMNVTKVPKTPDFVRGVINLRGKVIPVIDLRLKFGLNTLADTEKTCIIVVQIETNKQNVTTGILVDEVYEVLNIQDGQIEDAPSFGANVDTAFILGMGKISEKVVSLLDIDKVLSGNDVDEVEKIAA
jgi:purine-binding chemotaxis protein CheW